MILRWRLSFKNKYYEIIPYLFYCFLSGISEYTKAQKPVIFKIPDSNEPGNVIMLYGGNLDKTETVSFAKLSDGNAGTPGKPLTQLQPEAMAAKALQATDASVKFQLSANTANGLFAIQLNTKKRKAILLF